MGVSVPSEVTAEGQPAPPIRSFVDSIRSALAPVTERLRYLEIDTRMLGMLLALVIIWVGFGIVSGGTFLTPRNLWNLSVQSASIAIMATGMVLVIVSRNIDLSVGSLLGFLGYTMAMVQSVWIPQRLGFEQPYTWIVTLAIGLALGALIGGLQGFVVAYGGVPSFIVTLGGLLIWRGLIFRYAQGQTLAPLDTTFQMLGGGTVGTRVGALGELPSWVLGLALCAGIVYALITSRRRRRRYGFPVRPRWAEVLIGAVACGIVLGVVWVANSYPLPPNVAAQYAEEHKIAIPPEGLFIPTGIAFPVVIMLIVTLVVTFMATRRRFGRYVYAIGGNPDAAALAGINVRRTRGRRRGHRSSSRRGRRRRRWERRGKDDPDANTLRRASARLGSDLRRRPAGHDQQSARCEGARGRDHLSDARARRQPRRARERLPRPRAHRRRRAGRLGD